MSNNSNNNNGDHNAPSVAINSNDMTSALDLIKQAEQLENKDAKKALSLYKMAAQYITKWNQGKILSEDSLAC